MGWLYWYSRGPRFGAISPVNEVYTVEGTPINKSFVLQKAMDKRFPNPRLTPQTFPLPEHNPFHLARVELALGKSPSVVRMLDLANRNLDQSHVDDLVPARVKRVIVVGHGKIVNVELPAVFLAVLDPGFDRSVGQNNITLAIKLPDRR
jgi:hypothetical protein